MNKKSIAIISSVLILTLMGCSGSDSEPANSASNEFSITKVNIDGSDAKAEADTAQTNSLVEVSSTGISSTSKNPDAIVKYNDKEFSVLNDAEKTLSDLGTYDTSLSCLDDEYKNYVFSSNKIQLDTTIIDGKEASTILYIYNPDIKTSKDIGLGSTEKEVMNAYGFPDTKDERDSDYSIEYHLPSFDLIFDFDINKEHVEMIRYKNTRNYERATF